MIIRILIFRSCPWVTELALWTLIIRYCSAQVCENKDISGTFIHLLYSNAATYCHGTATDDITPVSGMHGIGDGYYPSHTCQRTSTGDRPKHLDVWGAGQYFNVNRRRTQIYTDWKLPLSVSPRKVQSSQRHCKLYCAICPKTPQN